jgi:hypothetical protein
LFHKHTLDILGTNAELKLQMVLLLVQTVDCRLALTTLVPSVREKNFGEYLIALDALFHFSTLDKTRAARPRIAQSPQLGENPGIQAGLSGLPLSALYRLGLAHSIQELQTQPRSTKD